MVYASESHSALPSHTFSLLSVHSYLAYIAFKCELLQQCSSNKAVLSLCLLVS